MKLEKWVYRGFFVLSFLLSYSLQARGPHGSGPDPVLPIDTRQADDLLKKVREQRLSGDYSFKFQLEHVPRRGEKKFYQGILWGTWHEEGPWIRFIVFEEGGDPIHRVHMLIHGGSNPCIWTMENDQAILLSESDSFLPIFDGIIYTPFDLSMSFLYWPHYAYEGPTRIKGRPAHQFLMYAPHEVDSNCVNVRIAIDESFAALMKAEYMDQDKKAVRAFKILDFKKVNEAWMVKSMELVDHESRDKTRFRVIGAATHLVFNRDIFDPLLAHKIWPEVPGDQYQYLGH